MMTLSPIVKKIISISVMAASSIGSAVITQMQQKKAVEEVGEKVSKEVMKQMKKDFFV